MDTWYKHQKKNIVKTYKSSYNSQHCMLQLLLKPHFTPRISSAYTLLPDVQIITASAELGLLRSSNDADPPS